tara:strand:- start:1525 stop:1854 length:330 start_codon:yes stop_codon:yes gene_type:complete
VLASLNLAFLVNVLRKNMNQGGKFLFIFAWFCLACDHILFRFMPMHFDTESTDITCPYCGESYELVVDTSAGEQNYIEDCFVCCAPINFTIQIDGQGNFNVLARHENDC